MSCTPWQVEQSGEYCARRFRWWRYLYLSDRLRRASRSSAALLLYFGLYAYAFATLYTQAEAERVAGGDLQPVEVQLASGSYDGGDATRPFSAGLLGATSAYVFLLDVETGGVTVVPVENLASMKVR